MTFYRPGGGDSRISRQFDEVFADFDGGATGWLPVTQGNTIAVNICRAIIDYKTAAQSTVTRSALAPEAQVLLEMKTRGDETPWPIDRWQNLVVASQRTAHRNGWVRLRIVDLNAQDGSGVSMAMQVSFDGGKPAGA